MYYTTINNKYLPININRNTLDLVFYHMNCADGTLCCALWLYNNMYFKSTETHLYPIQPSYDIIQFFSKHLIKYKKLIKKYESYKINFIFLDVVPQKINDFIYLLTNISSNISITIIDHHIGNKETIDAINHQMANVNINFKPKSLYGAAKQVVDILIRQNRLTKKQIDFSVKIAAMDMWNTKEYSDVNYIHYGISYYCFKRNKKMLSPDEFIQFSYNGLKSIEFFVKLGKKWYSKAEKYTIRKLEKMKTIKTIIYDKYIIGVIELDKLFSNGQYIKQTSIMSNLFCFMLIKKPLLKNKFFGKKMNTLAFIKGGGVSLRLISEDSTLNMDYLAKKICGGGGHKPAAGCSLNYFMATVKLSSEPMPK